ncbi:ABC transporter substrate-binding protein [Ruania zhangjianzhongii]|uniref:ABC transporter substrate-binding protein n=1 Tax=Ruania zhangjianzhongii TaxID=2603206 RepID=UPI0011CC3B7E|nr:ABC transporter substrate-binding protein [Ruania zhangjianzhongii]
MTANLSRRALLGLGLGAAGGIGVAGCGRFGGSTNTGGADAAAGELNFVWKGDATRAEQMRAAVDLFIEAHPDVEVSTEYQSGSEYRQKLAIRFASNSPPDVMRMARESLRDYGDRGVLLDFNEYSDVLRTDKMPESVLNAGLVDGKLLGVAGGVTSMSMVIDHAAFTRFGVEAPDMTSWSWEDFGQVSAELSEASNGEVYGGDLPIGELQTFGTWLRQQGLDLWNEDGSIGFTAPEVTPWYELWVELEAMGAVPAGGAIDVLGAAADQSALAQGLTAAQVIPSNSFASFNTAAGGELEMGYLPGETTGAGRGMQLIPALFWSISSATAAPESAVALVDFLVNDLGGNEAMAGTNGIPANQEVVSALVQDLDEDEQVAYEHILSLGELDLVDPIPAPVGAQEFMEEMSTIADEVRFARLSPAEAGEALVEAAQQSWAQE